MNVYEIHFCHAEDYEGNSTDIGCISTTFVEGDCEVDAEFSFWDLSNAISKEDTRIVEVRFWKTAY